MEGRISTRAVAWILGLLMNSAPLNYSAAFASSYARLVHRAQSVTIAQISEEDVPATDVPGPASTGDSGPSAGLPAVGAPGALGDWERVPNTTSETPGEGTQSTPTAADGAASAEGSATQDGTDSAATAALSASPIASPAGVPDSSALGPPPALDASTITTTPDPSEGPLDREIRTAQSPSLAASMRLTEEARRELSKGKPDDAIRTLGRAVSIEPANPFEYFYLGRSYMAKTDYRQALTFLKRAEIGLGAQPDWHAAALSYEGACYEVLGNTVDAAQAYQRALAQAPNNLMARVGYSRLAGTISPPPAPGETPAPSADQAAAGPPIEAPAPPPPGEPAPAPAAPPAQ